MKENGLHFTQLKSVYHNANSTTIFFMHATSFLFNYLTLISPLVSEESVFEPGDFPMMALLAFKSVCFIFVKILFDCF